jgi:hypothetical protein
MPINLIRVYPSLICVHPPSKASPGQTGAVGSTHVFEGGTARINSPPRHDDPAEARPFCLHGRLTQPSMIAF